MNKEADQDVTCPDLLLSFFYLARCGFKMLICALRLILFSMKGTITALL